MRFPLRIRVIIIAVLVLGALPLWDLTVEHVTPPSYPGSHTDEAGVPGIIDGLTRQVEMSGEQLFGVWEQINPAPEEPQPEEEPEPEEPQYVIARPEGGIMPGNGSRLIISKIGVSAPISIKGVSPSGVMQDPNGAWDVAWYNFTAAPGAGNAVFAGHVDYAGVGPAVFWGLGALAPGDTIVFRSGGVDVTYRVVWNQLFVGGSAPIPMIVGQNGQDMITLITCGGAWNAALRDYSHRRVVRAERAS